MSNDVMEETRLKLSTYEWLDGLIDKLLCPICGHDYAHIQGVQVIGDLAGSGEEPIADLGYRCCWSGRGGLVAILCEGECGHTWQVCLGSHKGQVMLFCRVVKEASAE